MPTDWKNLPPLFSRTALHPAAVARAKQLLAAGDGKVGETWCVAFSGGADSLALLLEVWTHWPERRARLRVLHFNHRLRGVESDQDASFCRAVCAALGVDIRVGEWMEATSTASEADAREARLAFFEREMAEAESSVLWTGHQKDDIAETLLMRVARGSGSAGLAAPRPVQTLNDGRIFLRPLLTLTKREIMEALRNVGASWREDGSNASGDFFRNRVRLEIMPNWQAVAENDAVNGAALTRGLLEEDDAALTAWLAELMPNIACGSDVFDLRPLIGKPRALLRRALRQWQPVAPLGRAGFEEVLALSERGSGRVSAAEGVVEISAGVLRYHGKDFPANNAAWSEGWLREGVVLFLPDGGQLTMNSVEFTPALRDRILGGRVDASREVFLSELQSAFQVRPWQSGDKFQPLGTSGSVKLQDAFVNRKVPAGRRGQLPLVIGERGDIVWIPGFPPAEKSKMTDDSVTGVHLTYETGTYTVRP